LRSPIEFAVQEPVEDIEDPVVDHRTPLPIVDGFGLDVGAALIPIVEGFGLGVGTISAGLTPPTQFGRAQRNSNPADG
jgi:hypothetical protein